MKRKILMAVAATVLLLALLCSCGTSMHGYSKLWILGKNSSQITDRYGMFDTCGEFPQADGLYKDTCCSYYVDVNGEQFKEETVMITIWFNDKGIAYRCYEETGTKRS